MEVQVLFPAFLSLLSFFLFETLYVAVKRIFSSYRFSEKFAPFASFSHPTAWDFLPAAFKNSSSVTTAYDGNPRVNDGAVDAVVASIREFGFRQPIVVDTENIIIAGHVRHKAAVKMGLKKIPVHVATDLTSKQVKAYRFADNKTHELSHSIRLYTEALFVVESD